METILGKAPAIFNEHQPGGSRWMHMMDPGGSIWWILVDPHGGSRSTQVDPLGGSSWIPVVDPGDPCG